MQHKPSQQTKIFISYSRKDRARVDALYDALDTEPEITLFRDTDDILPTEEWKPRLEALISQADTIIFALTPKSVASEVCQWELEYAESLNKRIIPIVVEEVEGNVPEAVSKLNYIFLTEQDALDKVLPKLRNAINLDIEWIREHTRIGDMAERWDAARKLGAQPLRGGELDAAEKWLASRPKDAPVPTPAQQSYIYESRRAATRRQRTATLVSMSALIVVAVLGAAAWLQRNQAIEERKAAQTTESRFLANAARDSLIVGSEGTSVQLALSALPSPNDMDARPIVPSAMFALTSAMISNRTVQTFKVDTVSTLGPVVSDDGNHLVFASKAGLRAFDWTQDRWAETSAPKMHPKEAELLAALPKQDQIISRCHDDCALVLRRISDPKTAVIVPRSKVFSKKSKYSSHAERNGAFYVLYDGNMLQQLDLKTGQLLEPVTLGWPEKQAIEHKNIRDLQVSQSADLVAVLLKDRVVVYNASDGVSRYSFGHDDAPVVMDMADQMLAIGYKNGFVQVIDFEKQSYVIREQMFPDAVTDLRLGPNNKAIVVAAQKGGMAVRPVTKNGRPQRLEGLTGDILQIDLSADMMEVMALERSGKVMIWQERELLGARNYWPRFEADLPAALNQNSYARQLTRGSVLGRRVTLTPDGQSVFVWDNRSKLQQLRVEVPVGSKEHDGLTGDQILASSKNGSVIAALDLGAERVTLLDGKDFAQRAVIEGFPALPEMVFANTEAQGVFVALPQAGIIQRHDAKTGEITAVLQGSTPDAMNGNLLLGETVSNAVFNDAGSQLAVGTLGGRLLIWNLEDASLVLAAPMPRKFKGLTTLSWSPDGQRILVSSLGDRPVILDIAKAVASMDNSEEMALFSDETLTGEERRAKIRLLREAKRKAQNASIIDVEEVTGQRFRSAVFLTDTTLFGVADKRNNGDVHVVDLDGTVLFSQEGAQINIGTFLKHHREHNLILSGSGLLEKSIWNVSDPTNPAQIWQGLSRAGHPALSADGSTAAIVVNPVQVYLLDLATSQWQAAYTGHMQPVGAAAFSSDGQRVLSSSGFNTLMWSSAHAPAVQRVKEAEAHLDRFTPLSRQQKCLNYILPIADCPEFN